MSNDEIRRKYPKLKKLTKTKKNSNKKTSVKHERIKKMKGLKQKNKTNLKTILNKKLKLK